MFGLIINNESKLKKLLCFNFNFFNGFIFKFLFNIKIKLKLIFSKLISFKFLNKFNLSIIEFNSSSLL